MADRNRSRGGRGGDRGRGGSDRGGRGGGDRGRGGSDRGNRGGGDRGRGRGVRRDVEEPFEETSFRGGRGGGGRGRGSDRGGRGGGGDKALTATALPADGLITSNWYTFDIKSMTIFRHGIDWVCTIHLLIISGH